MIPYTFSVCPRKQIADFIELHHYSHNVNGVSTSYCFKITDNETLVGAMIFGQTAMANNWKKWVTQKEDLLELRRLVCIDDTPRNTESWFIGKALRWLKQNTQVKRIISYADPRFGHAGTIYKASNFEYLGVTRKSKVIVYNGKEYHEKTIRNSGNYKYAIIEALKTGEAYYIPVPGKHIYSYWLHKKE